MEWRGASFVCWGRGLLPFPLRMTNQTNITRLLNAAEEGRAGAMDELMRSVYADLERIAERHLAQRFGPGLPGVTLEPAAYADLVADLRTALARIGTKGSRGRPRRSGEAVGGKFTSGRGS